MTLPRTPSFRLDGRRALVAGASSGIGAACAVALAEHGAEVTLCARRDAGLQALAAEIRTPLTEQTFANAERSAWIAAKIKLGRVGEVTDIMGAVAFLASDAASLIAGTSLLVDGGWTAD